ncbi:MAG TPA: hypothetical protein VGD37_37235 [Kofleriaceae bacterium]|jgi:hypothetical protein
MVPALAVIVATIVIVTLSPAAIAPFSGRHGPACPHPAHGWQGGTAEKTFAAFAGEA